MPFNYEQSIWGRGEASLKFSSPTSFRLRQSLRALSELSAARIRVLEVGCGAGQFIRAIKRNRPASDCFGTDVSSAAISAAEKAGVGVDYKLAADGRLPYGDNFFDAVLIFDVLEHVEDVDSLLAEIRRVLKGGGIFYCFVPCEGDWLSLWHALRFFGYRSDLTKRYAGHVNHFSRQEILTILVHRGFSIVRKRYSEHVIGQLLGVIAFLLMDRNAHQKGLTQINNEEFFTGVNSRLGWPGKFLRSAVNAVVNLESILFSRVSSPNAHITVKKAGNI